MFNNPEYQKVFLPVFITALVVGFLAGALGSGVLGYLWPSIIGLKPLGQDQLLSGEAVKSDINFELEQLKAEEAATIEAVSQSSPAVVSVIVTRELRSSSGFNSPFGNFFFDLPGLEEFFGSPGQQAPDTETERQQVGAGTGFIVDDQGLIITNKHVVADAEAEYSVLTNDGEEHKAEVVARDPILDLAIVRAEIPVGTYQPLRLGDSDNLRIGQTVIAIGNALGEFRNTVTKGVISGIGRTITAGGAGGASVIEEAIQTDAAISPGNSGGPLLDLDGEVVGVNTAVSSRGENIGFAIPINEARRIISSVEQFGRIVRPYLGVRYQLVTESLAELNNLPVDYGAILARGSNQDELAVIPGSPADRAGLEENDIILEVNGTKISTDSSLARILAKYNPGDTVTLKVLHDGEEKAVPVTLEEFEED